MEPISQQIDSERVPHRFIQPMMPTLVEAPPEGDEWQHEIKYDGYRTQLALGDGTGRAYTRRGHDWTAKYRPIIDAALELGCESATLDGEVVVADETGRTNFHELRAAIGSRPKELSFIAFDLLELNGKDLRSQPLQVRREALQNLLEGAAGDNRLQFSDHIVGNGPERLKHADALDVEGIVSKRLSSRYRSGYSKSWLKIKTFGEEEFVVIRAERGDKAPVALLARETEQGLEYAGPAWVTLADPERERFWETVEKLKTDRPPIPMPERKQGSWLWPELKVRARFLRGEEMLRHASIIGVAESLAAPAIRSAREPTYPKPEIDREALRSYYQEVAPLMLPFVRERPLNLFRCVAHQCFFQRNENHPPSSEPFLPPIQKLPVLQKNGKTENYLYVTDEAGILTAVDAHTVEFHGWGSRTADIERPDRLVIDLDPDEGLPFARVRDAALQLRTSLDTIGLVSFAMLTGGKGVHVVVPLTPAATWPQVRDFAKRFSTALAEADPDRFTVNLPKAKRKGRIFLDYLRNQRTSTAVLPYSARARVGLPVATPVTWAELDAFDRANAFSAADAARLKKRAKSKQLRSWGAADQLLPII